MRKKIQAKVLEKFNTHFMFSKFFSENRAVCEVMWKTVQLDRPQMKIWPMRFADRHSEYIMLVAFPLQQWLHERASLLTLNVQCLSYYLLI
jgi:hypothetical protein